MKKYSILFLGLAFIGAQAMETEDFIHIPIVNQGGQQINAISIILDPYLSCYDIQDILRQKVGLGNIRPRIGERIQNINNYSTPLYTLFPSPQAIQAWVDASLFRFVVNQ